MGFLDFSGRRIMVIGASSGIGQAAAVLLSQLGAELVLVGRNEKGLSQTKELLHNSLHHRAVPYDVTDLEHSSALFDMAVEDGKKLDGLVYCAGIARPVPLRAISPAGFTEIFSVNYFGFIRMVQCYARRKYNNGGSIIGVSAVNAHYPQKCMTLYSASKAAIEASVSTLALELGQQGIRINSVIPGAVDTPMVRDTEPTALASIVSKQLLGMQKPEDIANMIAFLLSERASTITGRNIFVDGGVLGQ